MIPAVTLWPRPSPEAVVREHGPEVYRCLKRIFGPRTDIDDAYQSVFVEVLRALPSFAGRARLSAWIRRITYNVAYQEMRLRYRQPELVVVEDLPSAAPEPALERREAMRLLYAALDALEPAQRLAVALHDIEGLTLKEIAAETGRPLPTVAAQLAAGRTRVARALSGVAAGGAGEASPRAGKEVEP